VPHRTLGKRFAQYHFRSQALRIREDMPGQPLQLDSRSQHRRQLDCLLWVQG
jgi:hypothetical protein